MLLILALEKWEWEYKNFKVIFEYIKKLKANPGYGVDVYLEGLWGWSLSQCGYRRLQDVL